MYESPHSFFADAEVFAGFRSRHGLELRVTVGQTLNLTPDQITCTIGCEVPGDTPDKGVLRTTFGFSIGYAF